MNENALDTILALQITVAWAGEGLAEPPRLNWWGTDLVDEAGGGDFFARLLPRTHLWAALEAVRKAAILTDAEARRRMAEPDAVRTLFFWGFDLDEMLAERIARHKQENKNPNEALPFPVDIYAPFHQDDLAEALRALGRKAAYNITPGGRELTGAPPDAPELTAACLASALLPFADRYPTPFYRVKKQDR